MSVHHDVRIACDFEEAGDCWSFLGNYPIGSSVATARADAKAHGWRRVDGRLDCCPNCWPRRVRYHAGRPVSP